MKLKRGPKAFDCKSAVLNHALKMAHDVGYQNVTRESLATASGVSAGLISKYFGTMVGLRRAIMSAAVAHGLLVIIAQGLACGDAKAKAASRETKQQAVDTLI
jgi:hypothetical protein